MQGAARVVTYPAFRAEVNYGEGQLNLVFIDATGSAHSFPMRPEIATQIRDGLTKALSGIEIAQVVPQNGEKLL